jgi:large subunit ribosomal protein L29
MTIRAKDIRGNAPEELRSTLRKVEEELFRSRIKKSVNQLENVMLIRTARRDVARIKTVLSDQRNQALKGAPK